MEYEFDVMVIGAGIVGLAAARELSKAGFSTGLIEKNATYGLETSSRNSEVIHSGIHYPCGSLKARLCVEGNSLMYEYCRKESVLHEKTGKLTVAVAQEEIPELQRLYTQGITNGVAGMKFMEGREISEILPVLKCEKGLFTPTTGLVNAHNLMDSLYRDFVGSNGMAGFGERVTAIEKLEEGFRVIAGEEPAEYTTKILVNSAGLFAGEIAGMLGIKYPVYWAKGDYFSIEQHFDLGMLVYPVPGKDSLGIHLTPKMGGGLRAGPDIEYVEKKEPPYPEEGRKSAFTVDAGKRDKFFEEAKAYLPGIRKESLVPEMYGIRAKLQGPGEEFRDFVIREEIPGFINLSGIESPGLTSCLSIARHVKKMAENILQG